MSMLWPSPIAREKLKPVRLARKTTHSTHLRGTTHLFEGHHPFEENHSFHHVGKLIRRSLPKHWKTTELQTSSALPFMVFLSILNDRTSQLKDMGPRMGAQANRHWLNISNIQCSIPARPRRLQLLVLFQKAIIVFKQNSPSSLS